MSTHSFGNSSLLTFIRWDEGKGLLVRFKNGRLYRYPSATEETFEAIKASDSPGGTFHTLVRAAKLEYVEVDE